MRRDNTNESSEVATMTKFLARRLYNRYDSIWLVFFGALMATNHPLWAMALFFFGFISSAGIEMYAEKHRG